MEDLADQIGSLQLSELEINYAGGLTASVKEVDILRGLLVGEGKSDVVVFGEGNFTFSMALASLRKSWDGITATRYEPASQGNPKPKFSDVKVKTIQYCIVNGEKFGDPSDAILSKVKMVQKLPSPPRPDGTWQFGVDATHIPDKLNVRGKVVWFQCPWVTQANEDSGQITGELVAKFLKCMASKQHSGDYALVGVVNDMQVIGEYNLQELLGKNLARGHAHRYQFLGTDKKFVRELLQYGYQYQTRVDDHDHVSFLDNHITLVFYRQVVINYAPYVNAGVNYVNVLRGLLAGNEKSDVVVFGEGNFTFSMALASLCKSWDGITATRYEPVSHDNPKPEFSEVKVTTVQYCINNGKELCQSGDAILSKVKMVLNLPSPPRLDDTWQFGVDATRIPDELDVQGKVVWFQCPWIPQAFESRDTSTKLLVTNFLQYMADKQGPRDYALVGIVSTYKYVQKYNLKELLGENLARGHAHGYQFLGADTKFVRELLQYGYKHEGYYDIHNRLIKSHITLVFRK